MASGRKNYFRHLFNARNDDKIQDLIDKFGLAGYYYFFALVEMCAELSADEIPASYTFHTRTLIKELRLTKHRLNIVLTYMHSMSLIECTCTEKRVVVSIPNLSKFMGRYTSKLQTKAPNKRKVKESKEKESKLKEGDAKILETNFQLHVSNEDGQHDLNPANLIDLWNKTFPDRMFSSFSFGSGCHLENYRDSSQYLSTLQKWVDLFSRCKKSKQLMGLKEGLTTNWFSLMWIINYDNILKVQAGSYDEITEEQKGKAEYEAYCEEQKNKKGGLWS